LVRSSDLHIGSDADKNKHMTGAVNRHLGMVHYCCIPKKHCMVGIAKKTLRSVIRSLINDESGMFEQKGLDAKKRLRNFCGCDLMPGHSICRTPRPRCPGRDPVRYTVIDMGDRKAHGALIDQLWPRDNFHRPRRAGPLSISEFDYDQKAARTISKERQFDRD